MVLDSSIDSKHQVESDIHENLVKSQHQSESLVHGYPDQKHSESVVHDYTDPRQAGFVVQEYPSHETTKEHVPWSVQSSSSEEDYLNHEKIDDKGVTKRQQNTHTIDTLQTASSHGQVSAYNIIKMNSQSII